ncbi:MAG TPA: winged helix-turn-helix domain-containing protein [Acidobacteriaceae bacterium]|nr:winged helix-turn-helix domain-containing protein [Acidobacteriaceae bacterium]
MDVRERLRFAAFELDLQAHELLRNGRPVKVTPQALRLLKLLAANPGRLVTREEIRHEIWSDTTFVDFEQGINKSIRQIRDALNDDADRPRFIETLPRRGYRFIAKIENYEIGSATAPAVNLAERARVIAIETENSPEFPNPTISAPNALPEHVRSGRWWMMVPAAVAVVVAIAGAGWFRYAFRARSEPVSVKDSEATLVRLVGLPGQERMPAVSPDGSRVVFVWKAPNSRDSGIYESVVGDQDLLRLTSSAQDYSPTWSPDGRKIAFLRDLGDQFSIQLVPALGGAEQELHVGRFSEMSRSYPQHAGLSFSPDGKWLAFSEMEAATQDDSIKLLSLQDSSVRAITSHPSGFQDRYPAFSPSGNTVAFIRSSGPFFVDELYLTSLDGRDTRRLTSDNHRIFGPPAFTPDGREIVFSSTRAGLEILWRISVPGGNLRPVSRSGPGAQNPSISRNGEYLAYELNDDEQNIWRLKLQDETHVQGPPEVLIPSGRSYNLLPQFSPDGSRIAFQSNRSGYEEIWMCDTSCSNPVQVTDARTLTGTPRWSPDGRHLAFDSRRGNHSEIDVIAVPFGSPHAVARFSDSECVIPSWSHDGRWIYFSSNRGGSAFHVWKVGVKEGAASSIPVQISTSVGFNATESLDGRFVLFANPPNPGIWSVSSDGGSKEKIWNGPGPDLWSNWTLARTGLYLLAPAKPGPEVEFLNLETHRISRISKLDKPSFYGLSLSPDGKSLIYSQQDRNDHGILLIKNFR